MPGKYLESGREPFIYSAFAECVYPFDGPVTSL